MYEVNEGSIERATSAKIFIDERIINLIQYHATSNKAVEVAGVLLGNYVQDKENTFSVFITDVIAAEQVVSSQTSVEVTAEAWASIWKQIDKRFPDQRIIIGWYHSHPNMGVYLSNSDILTHTKHFPQKWLVAFVIDQIRNEWGLFAWSNSDEKIIRVPYGQITIDSTSARK